MTLPIDVVLDLHQDGLRVHLNTGDSEELRITGPYGEGASIPPQQVRLLIDWLTLAEHVIAQRRQGPRRVEPKADAGGSYHR